MTGCGYFFHTMPSLEKATPMLLLVPLACCCGHVVHRKGVFFPVTERVIKNTANHLRIARENRIPRTRSFGQHQYGPQDSCVDILITS